MALLIALSTAAVPIGIALGGVLGDVWRSSLPIALAGSGTAIAVLAVLSWTISGFENVFLSDRTDPSSPYQNLEGTPRH